MDLEDLTLFMIEKGLKEDQVLAVLTTALTLRKGLSMKRALQVAKGLYEDVIKISKNSGEFAPRPLGVKVGEGGVGSRGLGDWLVHEALTSLSQGGDAGAAGDLLLAVDGFHSRLSEVPLLMGFHATRAAIRDVMVAGGLPIATLIDVHLADDTDVAYLLDVTAGAYVASEACGAKLVGGSTLRIGGDAVIGRRVRSWSRFSAEPGDVLYATVGKGGGTITAYALTHDRPELVRLTLNVDFVKEIKLAMKYECVKGAFDWTNGGIVLDAFEISKRQKVKIALEEAVYEAVHPELLKALEEDGIDPLRTSVDSIVFIAEEDCELPFKRIGRVEEGEGVYLAGKELRPSFREAPYTYLKRAVEGLGREVNLEEALNYLSRRVRELEEVLGLDKVRRGEVEVARREEEEGP